jgi:glycosyltransferase involved in cell wall biosynthesis
MFPRSAGDWGGIFVHEQVASLRRQGVDARVVAGDPIWLAAYTRFGFRTVKLRGLRRFGQFLAAPGPFKWTDMKGVPTHFFDYFPPPPALRGRFGAQRYARGLMRWLPAIRRDFRFDLVHAHTAFLDGTAASAVADATGVPIVLTEHTGPFTAITASPAMRRVTQVAINRADIVIAVSRKLEHDVRSEVEVRDPGRIRVIGNGYDPEIFSPGPAGPPDDGAVRALWIGGYLPVKQPLMLVNAFARARTRDARLRLTLVGYGVLEDAVRRRCAELGLGGAVEFHPSAGRREVAALMQRHDFLVVSSATETFGLVVIEALGCGRPVLTTRCGGPEETVGDVSRGEMVENSELALAEGFVRIAGRLEEFSTVALSEYARARFSFDTIAGQVREIYSALHRL